MKTLIINTTQPRSQVMREQAGEYQAQINRQHADMRRISDQYRPSGGMKWAVKLHNYIYNHGFASLIWAVLAILFAAAFVGIACPQVLTNILKDWEGAR